MVSLAASYFAFNTQSSSTRPNSAHSSAPMLCWLRISFLSGNGTLYSVSGNQWGRFTCEKLLLDLVGVKDRCGDASHGADHAAQSKVDKHEEEHDWPEWRCRKMSHGFCEGDEGQTCALDSLQRERARVGKSSNRQNRSGFLCSRTDARPTLLSSSSRTQGSRPSWAKFPSLTVLMTPYISA